MKNKILCSFCNKAINSEKSCYAEMNAKGVVLYCSIKCLIKDVKKDKKFTMEFHFHDPAIEPRDQ